MAARAFHDWARSEDLLDFTIPQNLPKSGLTIGIDAEQYLDSLLLNVDSEEPLLPALGGLPFRLQELVDRDIAYYQSIHLKSWFVFRGLDLGHQKEQWYMAESNNAARILDDAWKIYDQARSEDSVIAFAKACSYKKQHILRWLYSYLHRKGVMVQTAPYDAAAHLGGLLQDKTVDILLGSGAVLVHGAPQVVTQIDVTTNDKRIHFVELYKVLQKLLLTQEQFNDLMLLSGQGVLTPIPEVAQAPIEARIQAARGVLGRANQDGLTACNQAKDDVYTTMYQKAIHAIKHSVSTNKDGSLKVRNEAQLPIDTHEFLSQQIPAELRFYVMRGLLGPRLLNWRSSSRIFEQVPLDGGSSQAYRDLVTEKLNPMRAQALALISRQMHRYYQKTDVEVVCWFDESENRFLNVPDAISSDPVGATNTWHVKENGLTSSAGVILRKSPIRFALDMLSAEKAAKDTNTPQPDDSYVLKTPNEILANTVWRFLHDRGYINTDHTLSEWGKAVKIALDHANKNNYPASAHFTSEVEEAVLMAFELIRLDILNNKPMFTSPPYSGAPRNGTDADKANTRLISRVTSLGAIKHDPIGYTGPLSRHLLAYQQMTAAVRNTLRDLLESHASNMAMTGSINREVKPEEYTDASAYFPFAREPDLCLGLVAKHWLEEQCSDADRRTDISAWFGHVQDVNAELEKAWKLWGAVNAGVQGADSTTVNKETRKMFKAADEWLQKKRQEASTAPTNGTE